MFSEAFIRFYGELPGTYIKVKMEERMKDKVEIFRYKIPLILLYTMCFCVIALVAFGSFLLMGKTFILNIDAFLQHYPLLKITKNIVMSLIDGKGISLWSQNIGIGSDTIGNLAIILMDPFNYIAILFPDKYLDVGYSVAVILRLYVAGLGMLGFLRYHKIKENLSLLGGLSYAFCFWGVGSIRHGFFLVPLILFPLVIWGIDKVYDGGKPYLLIFSVWFSLVTYIYFAYMTAIFAFLYILVKYFMNQESKQRSISDFFVLIFKYIGYVLISVCLAAPIIFSVIFTLMNAAKTSGVDTSLLPHIQDMIRWIPSLTGGMEVSGNYSYTGVNALMLLTIPLMFSQMKNVQKKVPILFFLFSFVMTIVPIWGRIMNGFSYSVGRWCYILAFFYVWASIECLENIAEIKRENSRYLIVSLVIITIALFVGNVIFNTVQEVNCAVSMFCVLCAVLFYLCIGQRFEIILTLLMVNIGGTYLLFFAPFSSGQLAQYMDAGESWQLYSQSLLRAENHTADKDFYRVDYVERIKNSAGKNIYTCTPANESLYWGGRSLSSYLSSLDSNLLKYNKQLGNNAGYFRRMCVYSNDNRSRLNFLQGVKYFLNESGSIKSYAGYGYKKIAKREGVTVQKQKYNPGLGYVFDSVIKESEFEKYSALEKEQLMMQTAVVSDEDYDKLDVAKFNMKEADLDIQEADYTVADNSSVKLNKKSFKVDSRSKLELETKQYENCEVYVEFTGLKKKAYSISKLQELDLGKDSLSDRYDTARYRMNHIDYQPYGNFELFVSSGNLRKRIVNAEGEAQGITERDSYLVNIGYFKKSNGKITIEFPTRGEYTYDDLKVYIVPQNSFDNQAQKLSDNRFTMTGQSANTIAGTVDIKKDGFLYLSLLKHPGWKVYIDGQLTESYKADICFTGVPLRQGKHKIELVYRPIGFNVSLVMFGAGCVIICVMVIIDWRKLRNEKSLNRHRTL